MRRSKDPFAPHRPHLVQKADVARRVGRDKSVITAITRTALSHVVQHGRVDVAHPDFLIYAQKHWGVGLAELVADDLIEPPRLVPLPDVNTVDLAELEQMRLGDISERWGGLPNFKAWLDARHVLEAIRAKQLKNLELEGKLMPRSLIKAHLMSVVDGTYRRLLQDGPKTIAKRVFALAHSGQSVEHAEKLVRDFISSQLRPVRDKVVRVLGEDDAEADG